MVAAGGFVVFVGWWIWCGVGIFFREARFEPALSRRISVLGFDVGDELPHGVAAFTSAGVLSLG